MNICSAYIKCLETSPIWHKNLSMAPFYFWGPSTKTRTHHTADFVTETLTSTIKQNVQKNCCEKSRDLQLKLFCATVLCLLHYNHFTDGLCRSGESGAGKTESTKLLLRHIMELCKANSQLEQQILQVCNSHDIGQTSIHLIKTTYCAQITGQWLHLCSDATVFA